MRNHVKFQDNSNL